MPYVERLLASQLLRASKAFPALLLTGPGIVVPGKAQKLALIEAKATRTPTPGMAVSLRRLSEAIKGHATTSMLVHSGSEGAVAGGALVPGVTALTLSELLDKLA